MKKNNVNFNPVSNGNPRKGEVVMSLLEYSIDLRFWAAKNQILRVFSEFANAIISKVTIQISDKTYYRIFFTLNKNLRELYEIKVAILPAFFISLP